VDILDSVEDMTENLRVLPVHESVKLNPAMTRQSEKSERGQRKRS
jgi:hypothetical protein